MRSNARNRQLDCKVCWQKRNREWKRNNMKQFRNIGSKSHYKSRYGLSLEQVFEMKSIRSNCCDICFSSHKLCVDHCHITGFVRGILCDSCNVGLARFKDNSVYLTNALDYLKK